MTENRLDQFAPYPTKPSEATADALARNFTVLAQVNWRRMLDADTDQERREGTNLLVNLYGIVRLLRALQSVAPEAADEVARDLWEDWDDGSGIGADLWVCLTGYGIDPERVNDAAEELLEEAAAKREAEAAKLAELEQAQRGAKELGKIVVFLGDLIKDAFMKGGDDPVGALQMLGDYLAEALPPEEGVEEFNRVYAALEERRRELAKPGAVST